MRSIATKAALGLTAALLLGLLQQACSISTKFWEYEGQAPVRSVGKPSGFNGDAFGTLMAPVLVRTEGTGLDDELEGDYLAVAGAFASEVILFRFSKEQELVDGDLHARYPTPIPDNFHASDFAASIAGAPLWRIGADLRAGCTVVGVPGLSQIEILDIGDVRAVHSMPSLAEAGTHVDAVVREPGTPVDGFLVGGRSGAAFVPASLATEGQMLEVTPPIPAPPAITGVTSGSVGPGHEPYLAMGSDGKVFVYLYDPAFSRYELEECIESSAPGFGTVIASADADGDSLEDLILSSGAGVPGRYDKVAVVRGSRFDGNFTSSPSSCTALASPAMAPDLIAELTCADVAERGVSCGAESMFGSAVAVGDLDAESPPEIIVGAPGAVVEGTPGAGAAFIFHAPLIDPVSVLRASAPDEDRQLASSVAVLSIAGRDEVFIGVPEGEKVLLYYCSGVGTDTSPPGDNFCRPQPGP